VSNDAQVAIRLPEDFLERADKLVARMEKDPALSAWRVSRSAVLRQAVQKGLEALEAQYGRPRVG